MYAKQMLWISGAGLVGKINTHQIDIERGQNVSRNFILKCENCYQRIS